MAQITGRAFIAVNGTRLRSREGAKLSFGGVERETVVGDTGVHGYTEKTVAPSVECSISHGADTNLTELRDIKDASVIFETDTGKVYTLGGAWLSNPIEMEKGEIKLTFVGITCEES